MNCYKKNGRQKAPASAQTLPPRVTEAAFASRKEREPMSGRYDKAELLVALWRLGEGDEKRLPTSHGILDRTLKDCLGEIPQELRDGLSFGVTSVGLRCYELPDILLAAQEAELTTEPNPTYLSSMVTLDEVTARQVVVSHGLSTAEAVRIGTHLKQHASKLRSQSLGALDSPSAAA
jgi:hypothetical protein